MATFPSLRNPVYATLSQVKAIAGIQDTATADDTLILAFCESAARQIDHYCNRRFFPRYQTLKVDWQGMSFDLDLPDDLIALTTLTNGDGNTIPATSGSTTVIYYYPPSEYPRYKISLGWNSGYVFLFSGTWQQAISVNALWGYPAYEETGEWKFTTAATVQNVTSQNATTTTLTVATGNFNPGHLLYIEDEFELVQAVTAGTPNDTLTVLRGACGSTAAVHLNGTAISQVLVHPTIFQAMHQLTIFSYRKKDDANYGTVGMAGFGQLLLPNEIPEHIKGILNNLRRGHNVRR